ncbi:hypothetical protein EST38_g6857 [Candolleomyces aberdarensis]|uniref:CHAT domain-containing protein n=1 Tax=Candolleomyces aberdarensis TaxID=2316362 RepID=A0A4Q2DJZ1_9AGAR|nr:hypothetical protein EST38_g6857 [Candolleomyces aberdarensis]
MSKQSTDAAETEPAHVGIGDPLTVWRSGNEYQWKRISWLLPPRYVSSHFAQRLLLGTYVCHPELADLTIELCPSIPNPLPVTAFEIPEIDADAAGLALFDVRGRKSILLILPKVSESKYVFEGTVELPKRDTDMFAALAMHVPTRTLRAIDINICTCSDYSEELTEFFELWAQQARIGREEADKKARESPCDLNLSTLGGTIIASRFPANSVWPNKVEKAIAGYKDLIQTRPKEDLPRCYFELGSAFWARHALTKDVHDLDQAICAQQSAVGILPDDDPLLPVVLMNLGISFLARFEFTKNMGDLEQSISAHNVIPLLKTPTESAKGNALHSVANLYDIRFQHTDDVEDLKKSIDLKRKSINLIGSENSNLLTSLAYTLGTLSQSGRYQFSSAEFDEMIGLERRALELAPEDDPHLSCKYTNLSNSLRTRFQRTGRHVDIEEAMTAQQKAIHFLPRSAHTKHAETYENVAASAFTRYGLTNDRLDLENSISIKRKAIDGTPRDGANRVKLSSRLCNLAGQLEAFHELTEEIKHLDEAISKATEAAELLPAGHRNLPIILVALGGMYVCKYKTTQDFSNLDRAHSCLDRAMEAIGDTTEPFVLARCGRLMLEFYQVGENPAELVASLSFCEVAIEMTPADHPHMAPYLITFAAAYMFVYIATGDIEQAHTAISKLRAVTSSTAASPVQRLAAARMWCGISVLRKSPDILDAFQAAIPLISLVAGLDQTLDKRHGKLKDLSQLSLEAAAAAIDAGKLDMAVEWLEGGRCIVWNQLNGLRQQSLDALELVHPRLAERFMNLSAALENASSRVSSSQQWIQADSEQRISMQEEVTAHVKLAGDWEELLHSIRKIPGFENLLRPPSLRNLLENLPEGVIVVINVFSTRCDALVLIPGLEEPLHIPLPSFSMGKAEELRVRLHSCIQSKNLRIHQQGLETDEDRGMSTYRKANRSKGALENTLQELWGLVVKPIFDELGFSTSTSPKPRVWWCSTGPLALLPLHAAGIYRGPDKVCVADFAISSYTPTVTALLERSSSKSHGTDNPSGGLLAISQPDTPNLPPLPGTVDEVSAIQKTFTGRGFEADSLNRQEATVEATIQGLKDHRCVHFACHASQNVQDPLKSCFYLHDGRLELSEIIKLRLQSADLAFLSACQTSAGDEQLSEEVVHLAAGMLAAGYGSVIATMWSIPDSNARVLADQFYRELLQLGGQSEQVDGKLSARALHVALEDIRREFMVAGDSAERLEEFLLAWVPYVHHGA